MQQKPSEEGLRFWSRGLDLNPRPPGYENPFTVVRLFHDCLFPQVKSPSKKILIPMMFQDVSAFSPKISPNLPITVRLRTVTEDGKEDRIRRLTRGVSNGGPLSHEDEKGKGRRCQERSSLSGIGSIEKTGKKNTWRIRGIARQGPVTGKYRKSPSRTVHDTKSEAAKALMDYHAELMDPSAIKPSDITVGDYAAGSTRSANTSSGARSRGTGSPTNQVDILVFRGVPPAGPRHLH